METWFYFFLTDKSSLAQGLEELLFHGVTDLSVLEDVEEKKTFFCGKIEKSALPSVWNHIQSLKKLEEEIDWKQQWELFCPYFSEGIAKIPVADFSEKSKKYLLLYPGAGFGDLSHPTTCLMMELMSQYVEDKVLVDLGCGSGVLGLFALLLGAKKVYAIDIDPKALDHAEENAKLNHLEDRVTVGFSLSLEVSPDVLLLNMIFEEQKMALFSFPKEKCDLWITSGILKEKGKEYLDYMEKFSLKLERMVEKEGWLGFVFSRS